MAQIIPTSLYGIIGWPLAQTLSPLIHNTGFQILEIPAAYLAWAIEPRQLSDFMEAMILLKIKGLSVTIPHKTAILKWVEEPSQAVLLAGAANTLYWRQEKLCADNTDVAGFLAPLENIPLDKQDILLLGAGGAASAVCAALSQMGCKQVVITSPGNNRQFPLAERFGFSSCSWQDRYAQAFSLVINATPLGMAGQLVNETPYNFAKAPQLPDLAYDLVYNPLETVFLRDAKKAGLKTISGLAMFYGQGNAQFKLWTGHNLPEAAKIALAEAL